MLWIAGLVVIMLLAWYLCGSCESFTSKSQKADAIVSWFDKNDQDPKYANFHADTGGDILDYQTGLKLKSQNRLDPAQLQKAL